MHHSTYRHSLLATSFVAVALLTICSSSTGGGTTTTTGDTSYVAAYKALTWSNATVTFPTDCTMKVVATGVPS
jgi:hypothetical protein